MRLITEPAQFPALIFDPLGLGIIFEYLWKSVPFTGIIMLAVLQSVGEDYENVARNLGATRWQRFRIFSISWGAVAGLPTEPQRARSGDRPERVTPVY